MEAFEVLASECDEEEGTADEEEGSNRLKNSLHWHLGCKSSESNTFSKSETSEEQVVMWNFLPDFASEDDCEATADNTTEAQHKDQRVFLESLDVLLICATSDRKCKGDSHLDGENAEDFPDEADLVFHLLFKVEASLPFILFVLIDVLVDSRRIRLSHFLVN